eukprot:jgi/Bigna1/126413/aug1.2_g1121
MGVTTRKRRQQQDAAQHSKGQDSSKSMSKRPRRGGRRIDEKKSRAKPDQMEEETEKIDLSHSLRGMRFFFHGYCPGMEEMQAGVEARGGHVLHNELRKNCFRNSSRSGITYALVLFDEPNSEISRELEIMKSHGVQVWNEDKFYDASLGKGLMQDSNNDEKSPPLDTKPIISSSSSSKKGRKPRWLQLEVKILETQDIVSEEVLEEVGDFLVGQRRNTSALSTEEYRSQMLNPYWLGILKVESVPLQDEIRYGLSAASNEWFKGLTDLIFAFLGNTEDWADKVRNTLMVDIDKLERSLFEDGDLQNAAGGAAAGDGAGNKHDNNDDHEKKGMKMEDEEGKRVLKSPWHPKWATGAVESLYLGADWAIVSRTAYQDIVIGKTMKIIVPINMN